MTGEWRVPPKIYLTNIGYREHRQRKLPPITLMYS